MLDLLSCVASLSVQSNLVIVEFKKCTSVCYSKQSYVQFLCSRIEISLKVHAHCACAFIQNSKQGTMIEKPCHCDTLLFTSRKDICPVVNGIKASFSIFNIVELDVLQ